MAHLSGSLPLPIEDPHNFDEEREICGIEQTQFFLQLFLLTAGCRAERAGRGCGWGKKEPTGTASASPRAMRILSDGNCSPRSIFPMYV